MKGEVDDDDYNKEVNDDDDDDVEEWSYIEIVHTVCIVHICKGGK